MKKTIILSAILIFFSVQSFTQISNELYKALPDSVSLQNNTNDYYGRSVAIDGDYAVVGAHGFQSNKGCAFVLHNTGSSWETLAVLQASNASTNYDFGFSVSISGDVIAIGSHNEGSHSYMGGAVYVFVKPATGWTDTTQTAKLVASDVASKAYFGRSVKISGDCIIAGAHGDDENGFEAGAAYVFTKPIDGWEDASETAKLTALDGALWDRFGNAVSVYGDKVVVGAYYNDERGYNTGAVYVFTKPASGWQDTTQTAKLAVSDSFESSNFGTSVDISDGIIVSGASGDSLGLIRSGSAFVFVEPTNGWINATQTAKLTPSDASIDDSFGYSISISGDDVVVGAYRDDDRGSSCGSAYVFTKPSDGWADMTQTAKLTANDGSTSDYLGYCVSISNENTLVGAYGDDDIKSNSGSTYVFTKPITGWSDISQNHKVLAGPILNNSGDVFGLRAAVDGDYAVISATAALEKKGAVYVLHRNQNQWENVAFLTASDGSISDEFGWSVAISGDNIAVGTYKNNSSRGAVYVFTKPASGWTNMTQTAKLSTSDIASYDYFGISVAISDNEIVAGASNDDDNASNSGSAYVFTKPESGWVNMTQTAKLLPSDGETNDYFGRAVSISEDNIVVGAYEDDDNGDNAGSAYVFTKPNTGWADTIQTAKILASDGEAGDYFGRSVDIFENTIVIGAYKGNGINSNTGSVYVYTMPEIGWADTIETAELIASNGGNEDNFGYSVSISSDNIVVGAYQKNISASNTGSAYFYAKPTNGWCDTTETYILEASDAAKEDYLGISVAISESNIIAGAYGDDDRGDKSGAAYFFRFLPQITTQVQSLNTFCNGNDDIILEIIAEDATEYQWYNSDGKIEGETSNNLTLNAISQNEDTYYCMVSNSYGSVKSDYAILQMHKESLINTQPVASNNTCEGDANINLSLEATGNNLSYQWYNGSGAILNATATSYTVNTEASNTGAYYCIVTGTCRAITSSNADVTINAATEITTQPVGTLCEGETSLDLTVAASGSNLSYQWYNGNGAISNATAASYTVTTEASNTGTYYCIVTGTCGVITSSNADVTINAATEITTQPESQQEIDNRSSVSFIVEAIGSNLTYQWQKDEVNIIDNDNVNGTLSNELIISAVSISDAALYHCIVNGDCGVVASSSSDLSIISSFIGNKESEISVYPNPFTKSINIISKNQNVEEIQVYDLSGKKILTKEYHKEEIRINTEGLNKGVYFLHIQTVNKRTIHKLVKE